MIKIKYKKKKYKLTYWTGPAFLILTVLESIFGQEYNWAYYVRLFLGVSITLLLFFDKESNYITIDDKKLLITGQRSGELNLKEIVSYEIKGDMLKIVGNRKEVTINLSLIEDESKKELMHFLAKHRPV